MNAIADRFDVPAAFRADLGTIFVSLELSKSTWLVTSLSPGSDKMSRRAIAGGDIEALFACFAQLRAKELEPPANLARFSNDRAPLWTPIYNLLDVHTPYSFEEQGIDMCNSE